MYLGNCLERRRYVWLSVEPWNQTAHLLQKVIQKTWLREEDELWGEKQEAHINCRIYFGYGKIRLKFIPWAFWEASEGISKWFSASFWCSSGGWGCGEIYEFMLGRINYNLIPNRNVGLAGESPEEFKRWKSKKCN